MKDLPYAASIVVLGLVALASVALRLTDSGGSSAASLPAATSTATRQIPSPTPRPTTTPTDADVLADAVRILDLAAWQDALAVHHERTGAYPSNGGEFAAICAQPTEAVCELRSIDPNLHITDGVRPYWYRSDGRSYVIAAVLTIEPADDTCPSDLPRDLASRPVACVSSEGAQ